MFIILHCEESLGFEISSRNPTAALLGGHIDRQGHFYQLQAASSFIGEGKFHCLGIKEALKEGDQIHNDKIALNGRLS